MKDIQQIISSQPSQPFFPFKSELGKEPVDAIMSDYKSNGKILNYAALDDIYHTTSWQAMKVKIAAYGITLAFEDHVWLCSTMAYHYGYWIHTRPRLLAYCALMRNDIDSCKEFMTSKFMSFLKDQIAYQEKQLKISLYDIPGKHGEIAAWKKFLRTAINCNKKFNNKRK